MANEQAFPAASAPTGGGRLLPSPASFYVTGEDRLRVVSANSLVGVVLNLHWRHAEASGRTVANAQSHRPASDRSIASDDYPLGVGSLLNVTVFAGAGAPRIGQTYVMVQLVRGAGAAAVVLGTLLAGYVTSTQALGWPGSPIAGSLDSGGYLRQIVGASPAPGAENSEVVPTGARWELVSFHALLVTSAAAGGRQPRLLMTFGGTNAQVILPAPGTLGPSAAMNFLWTQGVPWQLGSLVDCLAPLATNISLSAGTVISTNTLTMNAADNYDAPVYVVREWLEVT